MAASSGSSSGFDSRGYLYARFSNVEERNLRMWTPLIGCHEACKSLPSHTLKVLDYGSGPVIQNCISLCANATEVVFAELEANNRVAIQLWMVDDKSAFNWSPHFDSVVQKLEGRSERESREREQKLRSIVKGVVHCNILEDPIIEKGFEGPYDVVLEAGSLQCASMSIQNFKDNIKKLSKLVKPGGTLMSWGDHIVTKEECVVYSAGDRKFSCLSLTKEVVESAFCEAGFSNISTQFWEVNSSSKIVTEKVGMKGYFFVHGKLSS